MSIKLILNTSACAYAYACVEPFSLGIGHVQCLLLCLCFCLCWTVFTGHKPGHACAYIYTDAYVASKNQALIAGDIRATSLNNCPKYRSVYQSVIECDGVLILHSKASPLDLLGVTIDYGLNFNLHISNVCKKASQRIGVIMRLRNLISTEAKLYLFKAAILPHLTYCHLVWHFCRASDTRRLERVQERGLRAVFKDKQSSYQQLLVKAKLPSLYNRRLQDICILMYKVKHNLCPRIICDMFLANSHTYNLRQKDFYQPSFNTVTHGKHSIRYLGPKLWSKIPSKDRSAASLKQFKTRIRSLDLSNILDGCSGCYLCNS